MNFNHENCEFMINGIKADPIDLNLEIPEFKEFVVVQLRKMKTSVGDAPIEINMEFLPSSDTLKNLQIGCIIDLLDFKNSVTFPFEPTGKYRVTSLHLSLKQFYKGEVK